MCIRDRDKLEAEEREQVIDILVQILQEPTITRESIQEAIRALSLIHISKNRIG